MIFLFCAMIRDVAPKINKISNMQAARFTIFSFLRSRSLLHSQDLKQEALNPACKAGGILVAPGVSPGKRHKRNFKSPVWGERV